LNLDNKNEMREKMEKIKPTNFCKQCQDQDEVFEIGDKIDIGATTLIRV
jgi:hypothetical protein